jgi:hypothetical protein
MRTRTPFLPGLFASDAIELFAENGNIQLTMLAIANYVCVYCNNAPAKTLTSGSHLPCRKHNRSSISNTLVGRRYAGG